MMFVITFSLKRLGELDLDNNLKIIGQNFSFFIAHFCQGSMSKEGFLSCIEALAIVKIGLQV